MSDPAREPSVPEIVTSIASRSLADGDRLAADLRRRCWPESSDACVPAALEWVRRWGPGRLTAEPYACSCVQGRCAVCN
jgi:hypothetical protein